MVHRRPALLLAALIGLVCVAAAARLADMPIAGDITIDGDLELTPEQAELLQQAVEQGLVAGVPDAPSAAAAGGGADSTDMAIWDMPSNHTGRALKFLGSPNIPKLDWFWSATMEDLVLPRGYPLQKHQVITEDGAKLSVYRIPAGAQRNTRQDVRKPVVFLQHGVTLSSNCYVLLNQNESMAFILADAGFDVWMGNTRGNTYSRGHLVYKEWQPEYWYTSLDTHALKDLPAMIDYTLNKTGAKKLAYVGHSQGGTLITMLLSTMDAYNDKVSVVMHMGPVVFIKDIQALFLKRQGQIRSDQLLKQLLQGEFLLNRVTAPLGMPACQFYPMNPICTMLLNAMFYGPSEFMPTDDFWLIASTWPASVTSRNLEHWAQMIRLNATRLQKYDYGTDCKSVPRPYYESCNQEQYGSTRPPVYNLTRMRAPTVWVQGDLDLMSTPKDVELQQKLMPKSAQRGLYVIPRYSHMDFIWDRNARHMPIMTEVMLRFSAGTF